MVSSGLMGYGLRLQIPDVSSAYVSGIFRSGGFNYCFRIALEARVEQPPLKMPATDAGETPGICNLRPRPTSPEDTIYIDARLESLDQYNL